MSTTNNSLIQRIGWSVLFVGAVFLFLFFANLRSRLIYHGPNFSFLFWMFLYCLLIGIGLLKLKKWAVLLLFLPGILCILILAIGMLRGAQVPMTWALINYTFVAILFGTPIIMLRHWRDLKW